MPHEDPQAARQFSIDVVRKLCAAGHVAYWAGGCVRDMLRGAEPKDYDVATDATPDRIREVFGRARTLPIGAAFGVITVLGPKTAGQVEVATFREDAEYSDGRRPDSVRFSNAQADAQRRDFTINGMFYDPVAKETIDFVGGQEDLRDGVVRAIGNPAERIREDKLRMLRAIRFASVLDFQLDDATWQVLRESGEQISLVSPERISQELRRMLGNQYRRRAVQLLVDSGLLGEILPELNSHPLIDDDVEDHAWSASLLAIDYLCDDASSSLALAFLLRPLFLNAGEGVVEQVGVRLRLARDEIETMKHVLRHEALIRVADAAFWPQVQRVLAQRRREILLDFTEALSAALGDGQAGVAFCRKKVNLPEGDWNPPTLINGNDLQQLGLRSGPRFKELLDEVRDQQLLGVMTSRESALDWAREQLDH